jgi:hypothetical protein
MNANAAESHRHSPRLENGAQGRNRTTDTRIFNPKNTPFNMLINMEYKGMGLLWAQF